MIDMVAENNAQFKINIKQPLTKMAVARRSKGVGTGDIDWHIL